MTQGDAGGGPLKGRMLSRNPSAVALALMAEYETGRTSREIYADPYVVRHCYEEFDKLKTLSGPPRPPAPTPRWASVTAERLDVIDGDGGVTLLTTHRIRTSDGREFLHQSALVHLLDAEGKIYRVEAYYDPAEQRRDAFQREHVAMYDGVVGP
ncbi:MAG: hypothetical protein JWQ29_2913 [Phenylobacterium sp.]|nr:hypothetical protein [Phenylobacterium sp.]